MFGDDAQDDPAALAAAIAPPAAGGHFDELRGSLSRPGATPDPLAPHWSAFFGHLGPEAFSGLDARQQLLARQVRDNGITYNVYADADGPQRPWSLDLFPLIVTPDSWQRIEAGVLQRVRLLDRVLADVYGPQDLLARNLLPPALVHGHPGYIRSLHGVQPAGGMFLHIAAFDLARDPDGRWWVASQRTQAPSGLGYLLENRLIVSRSFPAAFAGLRVQRLAATYRALVEGLRSMCPAPQGDARLVLLTPGPYNETYFEHAYLARYLGLPLVEGSDLTVRDERLYLKTLRGLEPVHGILKRLDDEFLDPLELRSDSRLGVPGLLQAVRAGNVLVANAPGTGLLESSALLGFLPGLCKHLLGEELSLPSIATWWCGERAAMEAALPQLAAGVLKPTYGAPGAAAVLGRYLSRRELDEWAGKIARDPGEHTLQAYQPLAQMPTWKGSRLTPRSFMLRVFAISDGAGSWRVLPGGLTRIAGETAEIATMQRGGSSADTWVLTEGEVDATTLLHHEHPSAAGAHRDRMVTSRSAENLFWLGRYTERTENTARLARLVLQSLGGEDVSSQPLLAWLGRLATEQGLVLPNVPPPSASRRVFERSLVAALADTQRATSVGYNLGALRGAASSVRDRLSQEQWNLMVRADQDFTRGCAKAAAGGDYPSGEALRLLEAVLGHTAAMTGAQTDRMTRDDGWRLLSTGRHLERLGFLAGALAASLETGAVHEASGSEAVVALFDSTITFHARYQQRHDLPALLDLLVLDQDNPRSLAWVTKTLRGRLARLEGIAPAEPAPAKAGVPGIALTVPDPEAWTLEALCDETQLLATLQQCADAAWQLSDALGARYFTHSAEPRRSVGA
nr:circularly permuted type 2 ATP-grasp protein [Ramlibacter algicola]